MAKHLLILSLYFFSIHNTFCQETYEYIFISNANANDNSINLIEEELANDRTIEIISLGDNAINLLQKLSQNCENCKIKTVIGNKDIKHQKNPVLESFKFKKKSICPDPEVKELDQNHVMITLNSNWFIDRAYKFDAQNYDCNFFNEIHLLEELEDLLEDYKDWNKIIVTHHGMKSISEINGRGMGLYNLIPFYGQMYLSFRKNIGFQQDYTSAEYQKYVSMLSKIITKYDKLCILSGHDYLNHVIQDEDISHINVNTANEQYRFAKNKQTTFALPSSSFLKLKKNENEWKFEFVSPTGITVINDVFKEKIIDTKQENKKKLSIKPISNTVKASEKYDASGVTKFFMGKGYRSEWSTPVTTSFLDITEYDGGIKPYAIGGGLQTMSIKFKSENGKKYAFRVLDKQPEKSLSDIARESVYRVIVEELITTMHPYSPLVADALLDATDIIHIKPELLILKPNPALKGEFSKFVGKIGTLEEKPSGKKKGRTGFYGADKVVSSYDMFISLRKSYKNKLDPLAYAKARLMDMYLGDWDRHEDNWKWAKYREGKYDIYRPIPKDRDHVFSKWTGLIPNIADMVISNAEDFGAEFGNLRHLNFKARFLDRELGGEISLGIWMEAATYLQHQLTDEVIENAVAQMPAEVYDFHANEIIRKLKSRRSDLPRAIEAYYKELYENVFITGTNKSDIFEIERKDDGKVLVKLYDKDGNDEKGEQFYQRTLDPKIVKKIYCYGLDGDDVFNVTGEADKSIKVRIIGGSDEDVINDLSKVKGRSKLTQVYDSSGEDKIEKSSETIIKKPNRPALYDPYAFDYNWLVPNVTIRNSSGNGFGIGAGVNYLIRGFNKPGFAKKWTLEGVFYPSLTAHRIEGGFTYRHFIGLSDLQFRSRYSTFYDKYPFFYGIGNDTKVDRRRRRKLNRIDYDFFDFEVGLAKTFAHKSTLSYRLVYENHDIENRDDNVAIDPQTLGYGNNSFIGVRSRLDMNFTDNSIYPENGSQFELTVEGRSNFDGTLSGNMNSRFSQFKTIDLGIRTTFIGSLHYKQAIGNPAFYHLSRLGSQSQFRGYTRNRFIDKYAFLYNTEVRVLLGTIKTPLIQFVVGVFGFYDGGRVWNDSSEFYEGEWNNSYGGGIFFAPGTPDYTLSFILAWPEDDFTYSKLQLGFDF